MVGYKIDNRQLIKVLTKNVSVIKSFDTVYPAGFLSAGKEATRLIKSRIQRKGVGADGEVLFTRSKNPIGSYGQRHGTARQARQLQTKRVDLTFTGKLFSDFGVALLHKDFVQVGFTLLSEAEKMEELEKYYGADIFTTSDDEEEKAVQKLEDLVLKKLNNLFE